MRIATRSLVACLVICVAISCGCRSARPASAPIARSPSRPVVPVAYVSADPWPTSGSNAREIVGPQPVEVLVELARRQNPGVQAARSRVEAAANRVPQAASLADPMVDVSGWPFYPYVPQTAGGRMTVDVMVSQEMPWFGKRDLQAAAAMEEVRSLRAALVATELRTVEEVKQAYYRLQFTERAQQITQQSRSLLDDVLEVAKVRFATGATSQQDVLRLQAELGNVEAELVQWRQERAVAQADLAQLLGMSPETQFETMPESSPDDVPRDLDLLYQQAVVARPELRAALADVARDRRKVELAQLAYYPDFTWQAGWGEMTTNRSIVPFADGLDSVTVGLSVNLPVYRRRLEAGVAEATAQVRASTQEHDALRDKTLRDVKKLFVQAQSQAEVVQLFHTSILPSARQALEVSVREYQVGSIPFAQVIDNWRSQLRQELLVQQLQMQLHQTLASLATVVGTPDMRLLSAESLPQPTDVVPAQP